MGNLYGRRSDNHLWSASTNETYGEIDMRRELSDLLRGTTSKPQRGHWIVYRNIDVTKKTDDFDEVYNEGVGDIGYEKTDSLILTRRDSMASPTLAEAETNMGILKGGKYVYYFEHTVDLSPEDQIIEIDWPDHRVQPTLSQVLPSPNAEKFNIKEVIPHRADSGRIEYWSCIAFSDKVNY